MDDNSETTDVENENILSNIKEVGTIVEEGLQKCPLCNSMVKLFFINFEEKLLMCENTECEFPFGYQDLKIFNVTHLPSEDALSSVSKVTGNLSSVTSSVVSAAAWADIDKINRAYDSEDSQCVGGLLNKEYEIKLKKVQKQKEIDEQLNRNVENMKELSQALSRDDISQEPAVINNEKWIKNLLSIQEMSGVQLLRKEEMESLRKKEPDIGLGELKIDIDSDPSNENVSMIKIEITNKDKFQ